MEPQIRFCTSADGTGIAYATMGGGPPLVYLSSWAGNQEAEWEIPEGRAWHERLAHGRLWVQLDRRGTGASQREIEDLSLQAHVADVSAVVDHLGLGRFDLQGLSESASVAIAYAAQCPERVSRLVLLEPYPHGEDVVSPGEAHGLAELMRQNWSLGRRALADLVFPSGPMETQRWYTDSLRQFVSPEVAARYVEFHGSVDVRSFLPQVRAPTLVLHWRGDRNIPIAAGRAVAALIPDARLVSLEGRGSIVFSDISYLETIIQFLGEGRAAEPAAAVMATEDVHTILFTDVEGSTALTDRLGDAKARELLREHERIVREALKAHGGSEVKAMGDGFMASFSSATKALECAIAVQQAFAERNESAAEAIRVRIGLNAGEPIAENDDLFGASVNRAARIAAMAKGGEILVANVVRELAEGKEFMFGDRGETALRGFDDPVRLFEVRWRTEDGEEE